MSHLDYRPILHHSNMGIFQTYYGPEMGADMAIYFPDDEKRVHQDLFYHFPGTLMTKLNFPDADEYPMQHDMGCDVLTCISISICMESIQAHAFEACPKLQTVYIRYSSQEYGADRFSYNISETLITALIKWNGGENGTTVVTGSRYDQILLSEFKWPEKCTVYHVNTEGVDVFDNFLGVMLVLCELYRIDDGISIVIDCIWPFLAI